MLVIRVKRKETKAYGRHRVCGGVFQVQRGSQCRWCTGLANGYLGTAEPTSILPLVVLLLPLDASLGMLGGGAERQVLAVRCPHLAGCKGALEAAGLHTTLQTLSICHS